MIEATVVFMFRGRTMLLGEKTRKYCAGRLVPPGGKIEPGESIHRCAIRETRAECGLTPRLGRQPLGNILCYHDSHLEDILVHIFRTEVFRGRICDSDELRRVGWYPIAAATLSRMMAGDRAWIDYVVRNEGFEAQLWYDREGQLARPPVIRSLAIK